MFKKILLPLNPSKDEDQVVKAAIKEAVQHKANIHIVSFIVDDASKLKIEKYAEECKNQGIKTSCEVIKFEGGEEEIPTKIAELAEDYDLIVMGHCKYEKVYRFVHQSTAADLINVLSIPVLTVPEECRKKSFSFDDYK